ncbi:MAG: UTP--glucose-1-phosphate uridylyltransferase [Rhodobacteraceae bacterium]|nr:UTP--glucose-1-phosphate uridylyltransferase [Paracoccaceae bacterium]
MHKPPTKAIFPVAGLGTRFLPATKSIPKEMITLIDRPLIQYAVDEARAAGITEFIFVTARGKSALEDYFDYAPALEADLQKRDKPDLLRAVQNTTLQSGAIAYIRQNRARGLGHAVWCARHLIGNEPFAVILPDDIITGAEPCLQAMVEAYQHSGGSMVATMSVPPAQVSSYGIVDLANPAERIAPVRDLVEKPAVAAAPSNIAVIGRYILPPAVFGALERLAASARGGEIELTNAIAMQLRQGGKVFGYRFKGQRFDCGSKVGYVKATLHMALTTPDMREEIRSALAALLDQPLRGEGAPKDGL